MLSNRLTNAAASSQRERKLHPSSTFRSSSDEFDHSSTAPLFLATWGRGKRLLFLLNLRIIRSQLQWMLPKWESSEIRSGKLFTISGYPKHVYLWFCLIHYYWHNANVC